MASAGPRVTGGQGAQRQNLLVAQRRFAGGSQFLVPCYLVVPVYNQKSFLVRGDCELIFRILIFKYGFQVIFLIINVLYIKVGYIDFFYFLLSG